MVSPGRDAELPVDPVARLRTAGLRPTRQRRLLAKLLFQRGDRHITAELLHQEAKASGCHVSLATVYNTLHQFTAAGLLSQVVVDAGRNYFDTNTGAHQHFYDEDEGQLTDIAEKMSKRHYDAGETIIRKGDLGKEFFLVSDGEVEVIRADQEVALLGPGDFFGEVALISGEPRNATVVARNAVDTYVLGKTDFEAALATSQSFRDQLYGIYFMRQ